MNTVLVVDDQATNREFLSSLLLYKGYRVVEASDGVEALAMVRGSRPDLVICDILMPTMDGFEFVQRLRAETVPDIADTPVVFCTAHYLEREAAGLADKCGVSHVLTKPAEPQYVLSIVEKVLRNPSAAPSPEQPDEFQREHLRLITDKLSETADELGSINERLAALIDLNMRLASELDPQLLLEQVCLGARQLLGARCSALGVRDRATSLTSRFATSGISREMGKAFGLPPLDRGILGNVLIGGRPSRIGKKAIEAAAAGLPEGFKTAHSLLAAPIASPTGIYGWICLMDKVTDEEFSEEDERLLTILAAQTGRIYENGSLYHTVQHHAAELEIEIAGRKRIEQELRESERRFSDMLGTVELVSIMLDRQARISYCNDYFLRMVGRPREKVIGTDWFDLFVPAEQAELKSVFAELLANTPSAWHHENEILTGSGERRLIRWNNTLLRSSSGDVIGTASIGEDITEHRKVEEEVRETKNFLASVLDNIPNSVFVKEARDLRFVRINAACERLNGYTADQMIGKTDHDLFPAEQSDFFVAKDRETLANKQQIFIVEEEITGGDGRTRWLRTKKFPIVDGKGHPQYLLGMSEDITEQKLAQRRLQESERRFRHLIEQASDGIFVIDGTGRIILANSRCCEMLGYSERELLGAPHEITYVPQEREVSTTRMSEASTGSVLRYERMVRRKDGSAFPAEFSSRMVDTGEFQVIFHDISERRRTEETIRESESKYRALIEQASDGILITDADGYYKLLNSRACELLGYTENELIGTHGSVTHLEDERELFENRLRYIAEGQLLQYERMVKRKDGSTFAADISAKKISNDAVQFIFRDITDRKRAEEKLRASEEKFRQLIEQASDGIFISDAQGNFILVNTRGCQLLGYAPEELIGRNGKITYLDQETELHTQRMSALSAGQELRFERLVKRKDGSTFPAEISLKMLDNGMAQVIFHDITERRRQQEKIERLNRIQAVLSGINSAIVRIHDRRELFVEACRIASMHGAFRIVWIGLADASGVIRPTAWAGEGSEFFASLMQDPVLPQMSPRGVATLAMKEKRTIIDNDITGKPAIDRIRKEAIERGCRSVIGLPLIAEGKVVGAFTLYGSEKNAFDDEEVKLLEELAGDVSFALTFIAQQEKVNYLAYYDTLTGLPNRSLFFDRLGRQLATVEREHGSVALILLDLDRFRMVNETLGRQAGDELLQSIAQRITDSVRDEDTVARTGADSFAIAVSGPWRSQDVAHIVESRSRALFGRPFSIGGEELRVTATAGVAVYPADAPNQETLVANAEAALRNAKEQAISLLFYGPEMNAQAAESLRMENRLRRALENNELTLWYQPKVDLKTRRVTGLEALMRWNDPALGMIPPVKFIPVMEQTGMILEAGNWALTQVAVDCRQWASTGLKPPRVAVNVSPLQLRQKEFIDKVISAAEQAEAAGGALDLEITESVIMENVDAIIPKLQTIRGLGVETYIDDFGTGYSSLAYIARLPIHSLKIDRSFVVGITQSEESLNIVNSVISLAHSLKLRVVAEGVETDAQAALLAQLHCDEFQGYLVSKPIPPAEVPALLQKLG